METNEKGRFADLPRGEVHLWLPPDDPSCIARMRAGGASLLSPDERERVSRLSYPKAAERFVLGRVLMRRVLARYLDSDPADVVFRYNANGKPELDRPSGTELSFNLSHSASQLVLAVARARAVGVDVEGLDRAQLARRIARRFFSRNEIDAIEALGPDGPERALQLWSIKESVVKANGESVWDGLGKAPLGIVGDRIHWLETPHADAWAWHLAGGRFRDVDFLAVAVRSRDAEFDEGPVFRTFQLGAGVHELPRFEPEYRT